MAAGDKIYLADKQTLDDVNAKVGVTTDTGGTAKAGTLMGKVNALITSLLGLMANWTAARAANLDAAVSSRESEANAVARHNALLAAISTNAAGNNKRLAAKKVMANIPSKATVTLVDIQGAGVFYTGYITGSNASCKIIINIDGTEHIVSNNTDGTFGRIARYPVMFSIVQTGLFVSPTEFKNRFSVTVESISNSLHTCYCDYSLYE